MELELTRYIKLMLEAALPAKSLWEPALRAMVLTLITTTALAQSIQLSPEQQLMLNQLPPEQRQQARDALRQLQAQQTAPTQQSINETLSATTGPSDTALQDDEDGEPKAEGRSRLVLRFDPLENLTGIGSRTRRRPAYTKVAR